MKAVKRLNDIDFSTIEVRETRNDDKIEVLQVIESEDGVTILGRINDRYFGNDGFFEKELEDDNASLTIDVTIFFDLGSFWIEDSFNGSEPDLVFADNGKISKDYKYEYVNPKLTDDHVKTYIDEIWIDYQDDFSVKLEARMKE